MYLFKDLISIWAPFEKKWLASSIDSNSTLIPFCALNLLFNSLNKRLSILTGIKVNFEEIEGANHFFSNKEKELSLVLDKYIKKESALY